jgi:lipoprotein-anchoring transpeptidase ErfK/SrfK
MKKTILLLMLTVTMVAHAEEQMTERFKMNDSEMEEMSRVRAKKTPVLHSFCKSISAIDRQNPTGKVPSGKKIDLVLVSKKTRRTYAMVGSTVVYSYKATFGKGYSNGPKVQEGDNRTPEGIYSLTSKNYDSKFHSALRVSYPNSYDRSFASDLGVSAGGDIMLHGSPNWMGGIGMMGSNWTAGCVAMKNKDIDQLMSKISIPTAVAFCPL